MCRDHPRAVTINKRSFFEDRRTPHALCLLPSAGPAIPPVTEPAPTLAPARQGYLELR